MFLGYKTAIATFVQFVSLSLLGIINGLDSIISTCAARGSDCVSNFMVSIMFFILTAIWFGLIWLLGFSAQDRRSSRLAYLLIGIELMVIMVAAFNAKHHTNLINLFTSVVDIGLALWVILLAWRLSRARGGRIVASERTRRRKLPTPHP